MKQIKILIGDDSSNSKGAADYLRKNGYAVHCVCNNPLEIQYEALNSSFNIIVLIGANQSNEMMCSNFRSCKNVPMTIMVCDKNDYSSAADICITAPINGELIRQIIIGHIENVQKKSENPEVKLHKEITAILNSLCITPKYNGFGYLREAIKISVFNDEGNKCITKSVYPEIARRLGVSEATIERSIRTAIHKGWSKAVPRDKINVFGTYAVSREWTPTNRDFVYIIADKLSCEMNLENTDDFS